MALLLADQNIFNQKTTETELIRFVERLNFITTRYLNVANSKVPPASRLLYNEIYGMFSLKYLSLINGKEHTFDRRPEQEVAALLIYSFPRMLKDFLINKCHLQIEEKNQPNPIGIGTVHLLKIDLKNQTNQQSIDFAKLVNEYLKLTINAMSLIREFFMGYYQELSNIDSNKIEGRGISVSVGEGADGKIQIDFIIQLASFNCDQINIEAATKLSALATAHKLTMRMFIDVDVKESFLYPYVELQIDKNDLANLKAFIQKIPDTVLSLTQEHLQCPTP